MWLNSVLPVRYVIPKRISTFHRSVEEVRSRFLEYFFDRVQERHRLDRGLVNIAGVPNSSAVKKSPVSRKPWFDAIDATCIGQSTAFSKSQAMLCVRNRYDKRR